MPNAAVKRALEKPLERVVFTEPVNIGQKQRRVFVLPAVIHLGGENPPKTIQWVNETGGEVTMWIPNAGQYLEPYIDPQSGTVHPFIIPFRIAAKGELVVSVRKNPPDGFYPYDVYCEVTHNYAQGNSSPIASCP